MIHSCFPNGRLYKCGTEGGTERVAIVPIRGRGITVNYNDTFRLGRGIASVESLVLVLVLVRILYICSFNRLLFHVPFL